IQNKRAKLNRAKMQTGDVVMSDVLNTELPADFSKELEKLQSADAHISDPKTTWPRPEAPSLDTKATSLIFQQMEIDEEFVPENGTVIPRLFGVTEEGHSVVCFVKGFFPYFYCPAPDGFKEENIPMVIAELNRLAQQNGQPSNNPQGLDAVVDIQMCMKEPLFGYHGNVKAPFFRIIVRNPKL
ncbi:DNA-directed DNA polymerase delta, partial [Coemansia sp. RSA 486]